MMQLEIICAHTCSPPDVNFDEYVQTEEDTSCVTSQSGYKSAVKSGEIINRTRENMSPGCMCLIPSEESRLTDIVSDILKWQWPV